MKRIIIIMLICSFCLLTGCSTKEDKSSEEIKEYLMNYDLMKDSINSIDIINEENDEEGYFGKENSYIKKLIVNDNRFEGSIMIKGFKNNQDATLAHDLSKDYYNHFDSFTIENDFYYNEKPIFVTQNIKLNGNYVYYADKNIDEKYVKEYFDILDNYLVADNQKQVELLSDDEFTSLYNERMKVQNDQIGSIVDANAKDLVNSRDKEMNDLFEIFENNLTDENEKILDQIINVSYKAKYFDEKRDNWNKKFDELKQLKKQKEEEASIKIEEINKKVSKLESNLDIELYDEIKDLIKEYDNNPLYIASIKERDNRLNSLKKEIDKKRAILSREEYKNSCMNITYNDFFRNSSDFLNKKVHFKGKVVQVVNQDSAGATLRVNVTRGSYGTWSDTVYVVYNNKNETDPIKILENDIIDFYGTAGKDVTYTTVLGASVTIPSVDAIYIDVHQ